MLVSTRKPLNVPALRFARVQPVSTSAISDSYNWTVAELTAFCTICETKNLTRASMALRVTQPVLSQMLRRWRAVLKDPLFVRTRYGVTPTEHALAFRNRVLPSVLELNRSLKESGEFDSSTSVRTFRLHMSDIGQLVFLPRLAACLLQEAPHLQLHITHLPSEEVQDALTSGAIDLAVGALPMIKGRVHSRMLLREPFVTVMRKKHYLASGKLTLASYADALHLVIDAPSSGHLLVESGLRAKGIHRRVAMTLSHYLSLEQVLTGADYLLTVPAVAVLAFHDPTRYTAVPAPIDLPTFDIRLYWHERTKSDAGVTWLREKVAELFAVPTFPSRAR